MESEFWEAVRQRAHELWLQDGCPEGKSDQHWRQAQQDVLARMPAVPVTADPPEEVTSLQAPPCAPAETELHSNDGVEVCAAPTPATPAPPVAQPLAKGMSLFKIKARQCRYIVSDTHSPAIFCGAPTEGGSWCLEHHARVFVRSAPRPGAKANRQLSAQ